MMEKADPSQKLYTRMRFWEFPDQYVVEPTDGSSGSCLAVSRIDGSMTFIGSSSYIQNFIIVLYLNKQQVIINYMYRIFYR